jgi:cytochrome c-type biogenesis protein CcmH
VSAATGARGRTRSWLSWFVLAVAVVAMLAIGNARTSPDTSPEARADRIAHHLRCPVCQSESVAGSEASTSQAIRRDIARRIAAGQSDRQIEQAYVDRYGEWILLTPSNRGLGFVVWGVPVLATILGGALIVAYLRRSDRRAADDGDESVAGASAPPGRRLAGVAGVVVLGVAAAFVLTTAVGDRRPGGTATGNSQVGTADPVETLRSSVAARPRDYAARIAYARALVATDVAEAVKQYDAAARIDPRQPEPPAYTGWLEALVASRLGPGPQREELLQASLRRLEQARRIDPEYPDAHAFTGLVLLRFMDDPAGAVPELQAYVALEPDGPMSDAVRGALAEAVAASKRR